MSIPFYQVDSFAQQAFAGNPAAVCLLEQPVDDQWLQSVAMEMNLSETAFVWPGAEGFDLRWFTPTVEVDLCGHATLAAAHVLWQSGRLPIDQLARFHSRSGVLTSEFRDGQIYLDFPALPAAAQPQDAELVAALDVVPIWYGRNKFDNLIEVASAAEVYSCSPDFTRLAKRSKRGVILTAKSDRSDSDFVSRFFVPACGIDEDPVTGSAHVCLSPYWSQKLSQNNLVGYQASQRGGLVSTQLNGDRVQLGGRAVTVLQGELLAVPTPV